MPLPPPRSTLFPYTTLFRSEQILQCGGGRGADPGRGQLPRSASEEAVERVPRDQAAIEQRREPLADRKSTRLNSSHGYISYAVFCLKKKNINIKLIFQ